MIFYVKKFCIVLILICFVVTISGCVGMSAPPSIKAPPSSTTPDSPEYEALPTIPSPVTIQKTPESMEEIFCNYIWDYESSEYTLDLIIHEALYNYYKEIPRLPTENYAVYVTHPQDDTYMQDIVEEIIKISKAEGFDELETIEFTATFVQSLSYTRDSVSTSYDEYPRYPIETLVDNGGDCEDTSILMASLLNSLGYRTVLIAFPDKHCAVGVSVSEGIKGAYYENNGEIYFYLETTAVGWGVGQIPDELKGIAANIYDITPTPILTCNWNATVRGDIAELAITVRNLGTQSAEDVYILAGFNGGGDEVWNSNETETFDLSIDQSISITLILKVPTFKHIRLVVQIIDDGYAVDESYSEWFDIY